MIPMQDAVDHLRRVDAVLAGAIAIHEPPQLGSRDDPYHSLVRAVISQQISTKAAASIRGRFLGLFGGEFPSPERILAKSEDELRTAGLSRPKARYILDLAAKMQDGSVRLDHLPELTNDEVVAELIQIKGVGEWTAHMFPMFTLGRLDILPVGDLGIRNGVKLLYGLPAVPTPPQVRALADANGWAPYESVACWYIWHSLDNAPVADAGTGKIRSPPGLPYTVPT